VGQKARWECFRAIYGRYQKGDGKARQGILNEFCLNTGYHRKYAIRLLNGAGPRCAREPTEGSAKGPELRDQDAGDFDHRVGSGGISVVGAAEGDAADVDAVDSPALGDRPRGGAGVTGDRPALSAPNRGQPLYTTRGQQARRWPRGLEPETCCPYNVPHEPSS
jgi:hypothetical protein